MIESDAFAFLAEFHDLRRVFPLRGDPHELQQVGLAYFKAMRRFPLSAVSSGKDAWLAHGTKFPKPAEWIESIPRRSAVSTVPVFSDEERLAYVRAETLCYEDEPCKCAECRAAGVDHRYLRFVPDFDDDDRDVKARLGDRLVTRGHWAHGQELGRWYRAHDAFHESCEASLGTRFEKQAAAEGVPLEKIIERIFEKRRKPKPEPETSGE